MQNRRLHPWGEVWPVGMMAAGALLFSCYATEESRRTTDKGRHNDDRKFEYSPGMRGVLLPSWEDLPACLQD